ncbi:hypothetical protein QMK33_04000 [Hymenobacter sp. H14-R3]|uniref:hypothetical protein n=1 Tax=Hymenobacter sp. H14-R3 TaxID=3046308 RepID=UPI0024BA63DF|nr:hypothetical protein [Hymenobacter sp. H14-R3]MDJ0364301.1 hypothetical protein [Hymenobacter sp. H14-R3]
MKILLIFLAFLSLCGCKKPANPTGNTMPPPINFALLDKQGNQLLTSTSTPIKVYFLKGTQPVYLGSECAGGGCTMVRETYTSTGNPKYSYKYSSLDMSLVSADGVKTFYLELGGKTDTLVWDVQKTKPNDPLNKYDVVAVLFNGKPVIPDPDQLPILPFKRLH